MKIMDRYLLREYLLIVFYCMAGFTMIYVLLDLFGFLSKFIEAGTPALTIARYYVFWLLPFLQYLIPASLLFATLYTLWHLTRNNELTAMRACGVGFWRIMMPFLGIGLFFSAITAVVQEAFVPQTSAWVEQFRKTTFSKRKDSEVRHTSANYLDTRTRQMWEVDRINPDHPRHLKRVKITEDRPDGTKLREITAAKAEYLDGAWWLFDARIQEFRNDTFFTPAGPARQLPSGGVEMRSLSARPQDFVVELRPWSMFSTIELSRFLADHPDLNPSRRADARVTFHSRFALPWASFIVTLFAIPVGARNSRQNMLTGVFLALVCFFSFYALIQIGFSLGRGQIMWPWLGAWLSNIVFFAAGLVMTRKLS